jgi:hypothetical protein
MNQNKTPTLDEFLTICRQELSYLKEYGFTEVAPLPHRAGNKFELWFRADDRYIIVQGEGWGKIAYIMLEHASGLELAEIFLTPREKRPKKKKRKKKGKTQLQQVRDAAQRLHEYGVDYLEGNLERFFAYAEKLPPYKQMKNNG